MHTVWRKEGVAEGEGSRGGKGKGERRMRTEERGEDDREKAR